MTSQKANPFTVFPPERAVAVASVTALLLLASWFGGLSLQSTPEDIFSTFIPKQGWITSAGIRPDLHQVATRDQPLSSPDTLAYLYQALGLGSSISHTSALADATAAPPAPPALPAPLSGTSGGVPLRFQIVGSKLEPGEAIKAFRKRWDCITSRESYDWKLDPNPRLLPWPRTRYKGLCYSNKGYLGYQVNHIVASGDVTAETWGVADSLKYVWRERENGSCGAPVPDFTTMDGGATCAVLRRMKGSLFIVGDSLSEHLYMSLLHQTMMLKIPHKQREATPACRELSKTQRSLCYNFFICGSSWHTGALQMHFAKSMFLRELHSISEPQDSLYELRLRVPELPWAEEAVRYRAKVIVLNRGAHFIPNKDFVQQLNFTLQELRRTLPKALIIYRSTPAGHPNCSSYSGPLASPLQLDSWPYNWEKFKDQNRIARELVEGVGGVFFDVSPMTSLRPDWHVGGSDCLHYCLPGPVDDWVKMLSRILQELF